MPDFSITDSLSNPIGISSVKWTSASSILSYAKSESLHLAAAPDFIQRKDKPLSQAFPGTTTFKLALQHDFQLGGATPEVDLTPEANATLTVNAKPGSNLFDGDPFQAPATVPNQTGYVGLTVSGSLDLGLSASSGDLTFGIDNDTGITFEYLKAFSMASPPTLGDATTAMLSSFVIPATVKDLALLGVNDICSVSGQGSLQVSGGVSVTTPVNPLASVNLPAGVGTLSVQAGVMTGLTVSFTIRGSWQIRLVKLPGGAIQLSYLKEAGTTVKTGLNTSAGVTVNAGKTDYLAKLLGAVEKGGVDEKTLDALRPDEVNNFNSAIKAGIDHSVQASIDLAFSADTDHEAAFQYEIRPASLDAASTDALNRALKGDLTLLTGLEEKAAADGTIAPGIRLMNSVMSNTRSKGASLRINLLGIVNLISMSNLISKCEFLYEPASGDLTIKETAQSEHISAITDPARRQAALREALFHSALVTTTYVAGKTAVMPSLSCEAVHFSASANASEQNIADYCNWFVVLNLMTPNERLDVLSRVTGGGAAASTVRAAFNDASSEALFFDGAGNLRGRDEYLEIGRQSLRSLLDPANNNVDSIRCQLLDDPARWSEALRVGPNPELGGLLPLTSTNPQYNVALNVVSGDVYDINWWADSMQNAGQVLQQTRSFLKDRDPVSLKDDKAFADLRSRLQKTMLDVTKSSKLRFDEPWGLVCLFRAGGSGSASGKLTTQQLTIEKNTAAAAAAARV